MQPHDHVEAAAAEFLPHGFCYLWNPGLLWTHVTADFLIGAAYVVISVALAWLVHRVRRDIPFSWTFVAFGLFIITCGLTHFMEIWTLWQPVYWLSGGVKVVTAIASVATAAAMPFTIPPVIATVRDARQSREREIQATRAAALEEQNTLLMEQAVELEEQNTLLMDQAVELEEQREEARELAEQLQAALSAAEAANGAKSAFLRTMSHELRTPLNAILGYEQLMEAEISGPVTDMQREQLRRIHRSASHLVGLVDEVLTLSSGGRSATAVVNEPVHVPQLVASAIEMMENHARGKGIRICRVEVPDMTIHTDAGRLRQILLNLLSNAVKFTDKGTVTVRVEREAEMVGFIVTDTGIGIGSEHFDRIFDPFWQVEQTTTRLQGGSGLGLAVSRQVARILGGEITVESTRGSGSTFTLTLPIAPSD